MFVGGHGPATDHDCTSHTLAQVTAPPEQGLVPKGEVAPGEDSEPKIPGWCCLAHYTLGGLGLWSRPPGISSSLQSELLGF